MMVVSFYSSAGCLSVSCTMRGFEPVASPVFHKKRHCFVWLHEVVIKWPFTFFCVCVWELLGAGLHSACPWFILQEGGFIYSNTPAVLSQVENKAAAFHSHCWPGFAVLAIPAEEKHFQTFLSPREREGREGGMKGWIAPVLQYSMWAIPPLPVLPVWEQKKRKKGLTHAEILKGTGTRRVTTAATEDWMRERSNEDAVM